MTLLTVSGACAFAWHVLCLPTTPVQPDHVFVALPVGASPALGSPLRCLKVPPSTFFQADGVEVFGAAAGPSASEKAGPAAAAGADLVCLRATPEDMPRIATIEEWSFGACLPAPAACCAQLRRAQPQCHCTSQGVTLACGGLP